MGFMDNIKKATGVGLSPSEAYGVAFEKGVLLGPSKFDTAAALFEKAAKKAEEKNDHNIRTRAIANARLYKFITTGDFGLLPELRQVLAQLQQIEQIGKQAEVMDAGMLTAEIDARLVECEIFQIPSGAHMNLSSAHLRASEAFKPLFSTPLITYAWQSNDQFSDSGQSRFFFHQGQASWHEAMAMAMADPEKGAEHMAKAVNAFKQCNASAQVASAQSWLTNARLKRTCWMCQREMQGAELHFSFYPASVAPYVTDVVRTLGHDVATLDATNSQVILCSVCGSIVDLTADRFAQLRTRELRSEITSQMNQISQSLSSLSQRISRIEGALTSR